MAEGSLLWDEHSILEAGVPHEQVERVLEMMQALGLAQDTHEPLGDPLTILRFLNAREGVIEDALAMYRDSVAWRKDYDIAGIMAEYGVGHEYDTATGLRLVEGYGPDRWDWERRPQTPIAQKVDPISFFGKLSTRDDDGAPIAVWRIAAPDLAGYTREEIIEECTRSFVAHLEDLFQSGRAISMAQKRLVRVRIVIDANGLGLGYLRQIGVIKAITGLGKAYFPEVAVTACIIRAPWVFAKIFALISPLLTPVMKKKICILGHNFEAGLYSHSGLRLGVLPKFLGGDVSDAEVPEGLQVPMGLGDEIRALKEHSHQTDNASSQSQADNE